ncbi:DUF4272 domain-containing protein [Tianweitania populi]|uniref:DUF4272 domain-containing protein n=1 Tax=Tianweitania populi TaxID=1607949 RepID=A0A8J3DU93_9HYPH|nr:DUF4272 domain-containing protein [Tianweitania populi]GHD12878.1 hypothetical protein GCM10016234_17770 [Tianweitania populi]
MKRIVSALLGLILPTQAQPQTPDDPDLRKLRSMTQLEAEAVPTIAHLPAIESETESTRRSDREVVERTIALAIVAVKGETGDAGLANSLVRQFNAEAFFTPKERAFMAESDPEQQDRVNFTWRYEGVNVLLWALGIFDELPRPEAICDVPRIAATLRDFGTDGLKKRARLRPQREILDAADLIYRYDWAVVNARIKGEPTPSDLDGSVVQERHHALNWLIGYQDQAWDDVSTDT